MLDTSIVNVALPKIQVELSAAPDDVERVVTGHTLTLGAIVPVTGWLGEKIGRITPYIVFDARVRRGIGTVRHGLGTVTWAARAEVDSTPC